MPVKLSGELVGEARRSAKLFHRSLTAQIEHWASLGRAVEARLPGDALAPLLEDGSMKISRVSAPSQRQQVMALLSGFLEQTPEATDHSWLDEMGKRGIPLYGTKSGKPGIFRRNPDGHDVPEKATPAKRRR